MGGKEENTSTKLPEDSQDNPVKMLFVHSIICSFLFFAVWWSLICMVHLCYYVPIKLAHKRLP